MEEDIKDSGLITIWMELVFILGKMVDTIKESIKTIKSMDMVSIPGVIIDSTEEIGLKANNMVLVLIQYLNRKLSLGYGRKENVLNGFQMNKLNRLFAVN